MCRAHPKFPIFPPGCSVRSRRPFVFHDLFTRRFSLFLVRFPLPRPRVSCCGLFVVSHLPLGFSFPWWLSGFEGICSPGSIFILGSKSLDSFMKVLVFGITVSDFPRNEVLLLGLPLR